MSLTLKEEILAKIHAAIQYLEREDLSPEEQLIRNEKVKELRRSLHKLKPMMVKLGYSYPNFSDSDDGMELD